MQTLSKIAQRIFNRPTKGLTKVGDHRTIQNTALFMAVHVELVEMPDLGPVFSIAHYLEQSGDLTRDPEITFVIACDGLPYPLTFRQDSTVMCWIGARCEEGHWFLRRRGQADHAVFAGKWLKDIKEQQAVQSASPAVGPRRPHPEVTPWRDLLEAGAPRGWACSRQRTTPFGLKAFALACGRVRGMMSDVGLRFIGQVP